MSCRFQDLALHQTACQMHMSTTRHASRWTSLQCLQQTSFLTVPAWWNPRGQHSSYKRSCRTSHPLAEGGQVLQTFFNLGLSTRPSSTPNPLCPHSQWLLRNGRIDTSCRYSQLWQQPIIHYQNVCYTCPAICLYFGHQQCLPHHARPTQACACIAISVLSGFGLHQTYKYETCLC